MASPAPLLRVEIERLQRHHVKQTIELLGELRASLFGVGSTRLFRVLARDGIDGRIDVRVATDSGRICGVVLAAPASYWRTLPIRHWGLAFECARTRLARQAAPAPAGSSPAPPDPALLRFIERGTPVRTWSDPGDAWRIIFVGTAAGARGGGVATRLYRSLMADRSLVARIALGNSPSIRLHHALGWRLYQDGDVALAVHDRRQQSGNPG
jgi:hypothetical protein